MRGTLIINSEIVKQVNNFVYLGYTSSVTFSSINCLVKLKKFDEMRGKIRRTLNEKKKNRKETQN